MRKAWFLAAMMVSALGFRVSAQSIQVSPETVVLEGPEATQQLFVYRRETAGGMVDLTRKTRFEVVDPAIVHIDPLGLIEARADGTTEIRVHHEGLQTRVKIDVRGVARPAPVSFEQQIIPLLTKSGFNSGGCHGKAEGQNGFKLSVFGFDPVADHQAITLEGRGRRVLPVSPGHSLLVSKGTGRVAHGGGQKIVEGSLPHKRLVRWLSEGALFQTQQGSQIVGIEVEPAETVLPLTGSLQLRVNAMDDKGRKRCVTAEAEFESNAPALAGVDRRGIVQGGGVAGEAAILVRFLGHVTVCRVTLPYSGVRFSRPPEVNFIDKHVWNKLERLGIPPSDLADDATFLRRVYLDTIGTLPRPSEARSFLSSTDPGKRFKLIGDLLNRPEYADYWALRWADLLRVDRDTLTAPGAVAMSRWLRRQFEENRAYDQFARDILTAEGRVTAEGPAGFFKVLDKPEAMSRSISQLFLGVRIECAQCHHHPSEKWSQEDYLALAGFFTGVSRKAGPRGESVVGESGEDLKHPRTGKAVPTRPLTGMAGSIQEHPDRRRAFARWMTQPENPFFARAIVNRLWAHYFGRGLVEPIDDFRVTNPATNEPLLEDLARHLRDGKYDLKAFTRTLLESRAYQLGPATKSNADDRQNFSHAVPRALPAEVLLDAISQATGVAEKFNGWPEGVRAIQIWDNRIPSYFLMLFGKPQRTSVCECERSTEPSIAQALHLLNAPEIGAKIHSRRGIARKLALSNLPPEAIIEELYLGLLARWPTKAEQAVLVELFRENGGNRQASVEDAMWALLNTKEFLFNH